MSAASNVRNVKNGKMIMRHLRLLHAFCKYQFIYRSGIPSIVHQALQIPPTRLRLTSHQSYRNTSSTFSRTSSSNDSSTHTDNPPTPSPIFSTNSPNDLPDRTSSLLHSTPWTLTASRIGIARTYRFKTFKAAWSFMNLVAAECQKQRHHPSWHNLYSEVSIEWTTHRPRGLSEKDVLMAEFCDRVAGEVGVMPSQENISSSTDGTTNSSKGAAGMGVGVGSGAGAGAGAGSATDARSDRVVQQKRALHIPAHAIATKLRRRFERSRP